MDIISRPRTSPPEMLEKPHLHETFFSLKGVQDRPVSVATEFMESDYDDDEILSELGDGDNSPRLSLNSSGQPSFTTLSSYEEAHTPRSSRAQTAFQVELASSLKQTEGPRGPHMFRSSLMSANSIEYQNALSMSPITPKVSKMPFGTEFQLPIALDLTPLPSARLRRTSGPFRFTDQELDTCSLPEWSPEMVAQWMLNAGIEMPVTDKFVENDINGAILITLKFEDLKELGIPSFGVRTKVWEEIHKMRDIKAEEPTPETPIEDVPDRAVLREQRKEDAAALGQETKPKRRQSSRRRKQPGLEDIISPLESVSIVGIEQMMPKPHHCKKGENCAKWKRNQRMIEAFKNDHPFVDMEKGGVIMLAGDPGNASTAEAIPREDIFRPVSDAIPSVVASSDIMGTGNLPPLQYLQEATLRNIQARDPQDNVRQFLDFQKTEGADAVPPTPPFEIHTPQYPRQSLGNLRNLPRLAIPGPPRSATAPPPRSAAPLSALPTPAQAYQPYIPFTSSNLTAEPEIVDIALEPSPEQTPTAPYRFGTPFSDMDVPVTLQPTGPIARDASQSVPPDMNYRHAPRRSMSRASSRRPSFPVMPALDENRVAAPPQQQRAQTSPLRRMQPPPRVQYPWTPAQKTYETALAPLRAPHSSSSLPSSSASSVAGSSAGIATFTPAPSVSTTPSSVKDAEGVTYAGPMRKRKTRMLRHEWNEHFCTLKGSRLAVHPANPSARAKTLEYIDVDDYAILCSSTMATSKLSAAFKAMNIRRDSPKADAGAFAFQLVPQDQRGGVKLRKRESAMAFGMGKEVREEGVEGVNGTGKAHHFAVKGRDERIEWMRELMLAKALKQKGEGFEVSVNGNMI